MNNHILSPDEMRKRALEAYRDGDLEQAISRFHAAQEAYVQSGDHAMAAEMANDLCVALLKAERPEEALAAVQDTPASFAALGDDPRTAQAYGNLASALEANRDYDGAEQAYRCAVELFAEIGDTENRAHTLKALSQLQLRQGQTLEAVASMQAGLEEQGHLSFFQRLLRRFLKLPYRILGG